MPRIPPAELARLKSEISVEQLQCNVRLDRTLARVASDVLAYLSVVALEGDEDDEVVIELHNTDQRLIGICTRGCGIVFCEQGRTRFESAATRVLIQLEGAPTGGPTDTPEAQPPIPCGGSLNMGPSCMKQLCTFGGVQHAI